MTFGGTSGLLRSSDRVTGRAQDRETLDSARPTGRQPARPGGRRGSSRLTLRHP